MPRSNLSNDDDFRVQVSRSCWVGSTVWRAGVRLICTLREYSFEATKGFRSHNTTRLVQKRDPTTCRPPTSIVRILGKEI
ncbi:hypothetical protein G7K_2107-t1 [Saitoella complicata NRRL Y-17804]|uniref:Uncharacterized protein n=1 Tax=Saitoella complicata (strain BCRC 22490 / CBS 7301 / JCM 7358 / NBRC 10748 / NRRL Y-17804) TaxID=698492 RepID=A0A0E9NDY5_SAICN|nr:hypothetical protein G7K_2107-t1 [Saitoella complicata NRRL Y-17804]